MLLRDLPVFNHPDVAALAWAIGSPPLLKEEVSGLKIFSEEWCDAQLNHHMNWLRDLDQNPEPLVEWLELSANKLLGKRFESLLSFWFHHSAAFECLRSNILLKYEGNSSGEADFIIRDKSSGEILHIEAACKYYIGFPHTSKRADWIGPNGHDSLLLKIEKLQKQSKIFQSTEGLQYLKREGLKIDRSVVLIKGYFFHPYSEMMYPKAPVDANRHYSSGWYVRMNELDVFAESPAQWLVLPKARWMCPFHFTDENVTVLNGEEMIFEVKREIKLRNKAVLILQVERDGTMLREISRGFVVKG